VLQRMNYNVRSAHDFNERRMRYNQKMGTRAVVNEVRCLLNLTTHANFSFHVDNIWQSSSAERHTISSKCITSASPRVNRHSQDA